MRWDNSGAERAGWIFADSSNEVNAAGRTRWDFTCAVEFDVRRKVVGEMDGFSICFMVFQSELIRGSIKLAKVVEAGVRGAAMSATNKTWNGNQN